MATMNSFLLPPKRTHTTKHIMAPSAGQPGQCEWRLQHVSGDLFSCPPGEALAHCISEDCRMGAGIAVAFRQRFGGVTDLKEQKKTPGQCAVLKRGPRFIYYLITKKRYNQKPTYESLKRSLVEMKLHCLSNGVTRISMPRIGCGLDRLKWQAVEDILEWVFKDTGIAITVYSLPEKAQSTATRENMRR